MSRRLALGLVASLGLAACGGGGGGGGPTQPQPSIVFSPSGAAGANSIVLTQASGSTATRLILSVQATQVSGLFGVAFDLAYPNGVLQFDTASQGTFLAGAPTAFDFAETSTGHLVVGVSRLGAVAGVSGSGELLKLEFTSSGAAGVESFAFQSNTAFDATASSIPGVSWIGGTATVVP